MSRFKAKSDLLVSVKAVANVINGKVPNDKNAVFRADFRKSRYAIILLVGLHPQFDDHRILIQNNTCINFYRLDRVAKLLGLAFDRSYTAEKIYRELEAKKMVLFFKQDHQTFITLTKEGSAKYHKILDSFIELDNHLKSNASIQPLYVQEKPARVPTKGLTIKSNQMIEAKLIADKLIRRISD
jgi:hypothetical protein